MIYMGWFSPWVVGIGLRQGFQKAGCKKTGSLLFKKRRSSLFFCILHFATHILDPYICLTFKSSYWVPFSGLKIHDLIKTSQTFSCVILCRRPFWFENCKFVFFSNWWIVNCFWPICKVKCVFSYEISKLNSDRNS